MELTKEMLIGVGNTADVFDLGEGRALKLFHEFYSGECAELEYRNASMMNGLEIPVPRCYELVTIGKQKGIIYDKIEGKSLLELLMQTLDTKYVQLLPKLHKQMITRKLPEATKIKDILQNAIQTTGYLTEKEKTYYLELLYKLPDGDNLCHGDFHFGNILVQGEQAYVIDFLNIGKGHPFFDIARTVYLTQYTPAPEEIPDKAGLMQMKKESADLYLQEMGVSREEIADYLLITFAARLWELREEQASEREAVLGYLSLHK